MSTEKKVELVSSVKDEYGITPALRALELPRSTWYYHQNQKIPCHKGGITQTGFFAL